MTVVTDKAVSGPKSRAGTVRVWDAFVRIFHWSLVFLFAFAYLTGDEWEDAHILAGYAIAVLVLLRVIWGFIGSEHARFRDFIHRPATISGFLRDSLLLRARRHLGHNPAGGAMVVALLAALAAICATGLMMTTAAFHDAHWVEEVHEAAVSGALVLIALHVAGVLLASFEHRENLVRSMFTGRKRLR